MCASDSFQQCKIRHITMNTTCFIWREPQPSFCHERTLGKEEIDVVCGGGDEIKKQLSFYHILSICAGYTHP